MTKLIGFPKTEPRWLFDRDSVRFYATLGNAVLRCVVSGEALITHFGARGLTADECLRAFREHRSAIEEAVRRKIQGVEPTPGYEVVLRTSDFPPQTTTTTSPPRVGGVVAHESAAVRENPGLLNEVREANSVLEELIRGGHVSAEWDVVPATNNLPLVRLTLTDVETGSSAEGLYTREDLHNHSYTRLSLFRLWDDLLRERGRVLLQSLQSADASKG